MASKSSSLNNLTPPLRSVLDEILVHNDNNPTQANTAAESIAHPASSDKKIRRKHSSSSSSSYSGSRKSLSESNGSLNHDQSDEDDYSSNDENNPAWADLEASFNRLRNRISEISQRSSDERTSLKLSTLECIICLNRYPIKPLACCSSNICSSCLFSHLSVYINESRIRIPCPSCSHIFNRDEIIASLVNNDENGEIIEKYKRFYADINGERHIKTCPQCSAIKEFDKKLFEGIQWKKTVPRRVLCDQCQYVWCFFCHAPWHENMTCKEYQAGEKLLQMWAQKKDKNQQNAQRCPRCKIFISRNGGCPHMICSKCSCDFCYNCGEKRIGIKFLGSHESRYSPFGCKYNLYPDKPILRRAVRGLVAGAVTLAAPVAVVGAAAVLAVGTTIGAPTYGTYKLVKYLKKKRRNDRRRTRSSIRSQSSETHSNDFQDDYHNDHHSNNNNHRHQDDDDDDDDDEEDDDDEDLMYAKQASLETYRIEMEKRTANLSIDWHQNNKS